MMKDVHTRLLTRHPDWPLLVAADLEVGVEPVPGPGSRPVSFQTVKQLVKQACEALADLGATKVVIMTFHGNPLHNLAIESGVEHLRRRGVAVAAPFNALAESLLEFDPNELAAAYDHVADESERASMLAGLPADFHAGFSETSVALHYAPHTVDDCYRDLPPCPQVVPAPAVKALAKTALALGRRRLAIELEFAALGLAWMALDPFPGYTGSPHRASAEAGKVFADKIVDGFADAVEGVFAGERRSPPPIMRWLATVTLGGRVST